MSYELPPSAKKNSMPRISVVMAVYNGSKYLGEALESLLSQSLGDLELIAVDDGSDDRSPDILRQYAERDDRIILLRNEMNSGLTRSLNRGIQVARGEYMARLDADDIALPGRFEAQAGLLDREPDVGLVGGGYKVVTEDGRFVYEHIPPVSDEALKSELLIKNNSIGHSAVMARLETIRCVGGYDESFPVSQDYDLWARLSGITKFSSLPVSVIEWRDRAESISSLRRKEQLQYSLEVSRRLLQGVFAGGELDMNAYERFWWAFHGYFEELQAGDLIRLESLWTLVGSKANLMKKTVRDFLNLGYSMLERGMTTEGFRLLWIVAKQFGLWPGPAVFAKCFAKGLTKPQGLRGCSGC